MTGPNLDPVLSSENPITTKKKSLQDLKYLLEDRGYKRREWKRSSNNSYDNNSKFSVLCERYCGGRWCFSRFKTIMFMILVFVSVDNVHARSSGECRFYFF